MSLLFKLPKAEARASAALPAGGALDSTIAAPTPIPLSDACEIDLHIWYTSNAASATGRPKLRVQWSDDPPTTAAASVAHWEDDLLYDGSSLVLAAGIGSLEAYGRESRLATPGAGNTQRCYRLCAIPTRGAHWVRVDCAEHGDAANPGTLVVYVTRAVEA